MKPVRHPIILQPKHSITRIYKRNTSGFPVPMCFSSGFGIIFMPIKLMKAMFACDSQPGLSECYE